MKVIAGGATDVGTVRKKNQDRITFHVKNDKKIVMAIACVCDGIGSMENSEIASEMVTRKIDEWFTWICRQQENGFSEEEIVAELENTLQEANEETYLYSSSTLDRIGCTMDVLFIFDEHYYVFHVGDSRICSFKNGMATQITRDEVSVYEKDGKMKTKLANYVGRSMELWVNRINGVVSEADYFALGSDGLFHRIQTEDFEALLTKVKNEKQLQQACEQALKVVMDRGERDNVSCVMVKIS